MAGVFGYYFLCLVCKLREGCKMRAGCTMYGKAGVQVEGVVECIMSCGCMIGRLAKCKGKEGMELRWGLEKKWAGVGESH